ncbi:hypothetical protein JKI95_02335 [Corynebacterium aquatimens]|uniref:hypothetical protein n=1 Tax=Corynebacterium TaxID=1716 RepID=UPI001F3DAE91|nr:MULTISPECIES: hypothetical protein [Corynebacterium]QYH19938.1 hypothetical protein JKI95_02335 [Corynebacterium aquatimens]UIZ92887.1 hypothetical protein JZY91_03825 [Corynebacterium sp. CNCTC7651]
MNANRDDFSRGEVIHAFIWLAIFALISAVIQVPYLGAHLGPVPVPWPIPAAFAFNWVLVKTARLWVSSRVLQLVPIAIWVVGVWVFGGMVASISNELPLMVVLTAAGIAGGVWATAKR